MTISTLMAHVEVGRPNAHLLEATARLAEWFDAHVIGVAACQPMQLLYGEVYAASELVQLDRDEIERETKVCEMNRAALERALAACLAGRGDQLPDFGAYRGPGGAGGRSGGHGHRPDRQGGAAYQHAANGCRQSCSRLAGRF